MPGDTPQPATCIMVSQAAMQVAQEEGLKNMPEPATSSIKTMLA